MSFVFVILLVIIVSYFFSKLARRFYFSEVSGLIVGGFVLTYFFSETSVVIEHRELIKTLAMVGLFSLMFVDGLEVSWSMMRNERFNSVIITFASFVSSLLFSLFIFPRFGFSIEATIVFGICFGITAEATKARALIQLKKIKTKVGSIMVSTGIFDDLVGVSLLVFISYVYTSKVSFNEVLVFYGMMLFFLLGVYAHYKIGRYENKIKYGEKFLHMTVIPFFFLNLGMSFDLRSVLIDYRYLFLVIFVSFGSSLIGVIGTKYFTKLRWKQLILIGFGMNSKGAAELAICYVALDIGLIDEVIYSMLIVNSLVSTLIFQIILFRVIKKFPKVMN